MNLKEEAQQILNEKDMVIITERVDDVGLLLGQMRKPFASEFSAGFK